MDRERDRRSGLDSALSGRESRRSPARRRRRWSRPPRSLRATRAGWCFIAILFGVGFAALNTGNNLLYLVLALMLAFLVLSGLLSEASLRGVRVERHLPREIFARSPNRIVLRVHNDQRRVACFAVIIEDRVAVDGRIEAAGRCFVLRIQPRSSVDRSYHYEPDRRGDLDWSGVRVSTRFPFGLFVKSAELVHASHALVYPRVEPITRSTRATRMTREAEDAIQHSKTGDDITGLRDHAPGDSLGRVSWRRSLRARKWLVGERDGESSAEIEVLLRPPPDANDSLLEDSIARAASEIVGHLEAGLGVGLKAPSERFPPATGFAHRTKLLSHLAQLPSAASRDSRPPPPTRAELRAREARRA